MLARNLTRSWILAVLTIFVASCSGDLMLPEQDDTEAAAGGTSTLTLTLQDDELQIVDWRTADDEQDDHAHHHHGEESALVDFIFRPADGSPDVFGHITDPRVLLSEFDEEGNPDPIQVVSGNGVLEVDVPTVAGELKMWAQDGRLIGRVQFDPEAPRVAQQALLRDSDILSPPTAVVNHGSRSSKVDILFLPEGYSESEMGAFNRHVREITDQLSREPVYRDIWGGMNIWRQDIRSRTRGTGSNARAMDTAFETASGISGVQRCIFFATSRGERMARRLGDQLGAEAVIVLVNSTQHGGCARDGLVVTARPRHVIGTVAHELGHALFDLADEYETPRPGGFCSTGPNVASSIRSLPWADMVNTNQLPTSPSARFGTIGAFEGAGYCSEGRYRPTHRCLMRSLNDSFCAVCRRQVQRTMTRITGSPTGGGTNSGSTGTNTGSTGTNTGSTGSNTGSTSSGSAPSTPGGLSPNGGSVTTSEVRLSWNRVSGASNYQLTIEQRSGSRYRQVAEADTASRAVTLRFQSDSGDYRWNVRACNSSGCSAYASATFTHGSSSTDTNTGSTNTGSTNTGSTSSGTLSVPAGLRPATSSVISDDTPSMSWNSVSGATQYGFRMLTHDGNAWQTYVSEQMVSSNRVSTTLRTNERWYAFSVRACNSSGCSDWTEYSTMYLRK